MAGDSAPPHGRRQDRPRARAPAPPSRPVAPTPRAAALTVYWRDARSASCGLAARPVDRAALPRPAGAARREAALFLLCPAPGWPRDCSEVPAGSPNGIYIIQPTGQQTIMVYCEMNGADRGWTVIQGNQQNSAIFWDESWRTYKHGFGNVCTGFWLGTKYIHQITRQKVYQVRFVIWVASNNMKFADYSLFILDDESRGYQLRLGAPSGSAEDAMASKGVTTMHNNIKFSAEDWDLDAHSENCAASSRGRWWYLVCYSVHLNFKGGMAWGDLCQGNCRTSAILIKPTARATSPNACAGHVSLHK
ncbi:fibrinogen-like protein 1-like protein [Chamaea fasciata]|uniref:fibrinogen-like protein 1-like protein n=1 Tax=Chamaea fasciata TaxID=190680 RepID=UPI003369E41E